MTEINNLLDESLRRIHVVTQSIDENRLQPKPKNRQDSGLHYGYAMMYVLVDNRCLVSQLLPSPLTSCLNQTFSCTFRLSFNLWLLTKRQCLSNALTTYPLLPAIGASLRSIFTFCYNEASFSNVSPFVVCSFRDLHVRCFSVRVDVHLCTSHFPCTIEHN